MIKLCRILLAALILSVVVSSHSFADHKKASCEEAKALAIKGGRAFRNVWH